MLCCVVCDNESVSLQVVGEQLNSEKTSTPPQPCIARTVSGLALSFGESGVSVLGAY